MEKDSQRRVFKFDDSQDSLADAMGISEERVTFIHEVIEKTMNDSVVCRSTSRVLSTTFNQLDSEVERLFAAFMLNSLLMDLRMKNSLMGLLGKLKGEDSDQDTDTL